MKIFRCWTCCVVTTILFIGAVTQNLFSQDGDIVELTLHACSVPEDSDSIRFLPREQELRDGNAAIELLRMPWEQSNYIELERKKMSDWLDMAGDDPELLKYEPSFAHFKDKMRRAAYTRDADWDYPIGEQPSATILLPDVQGMRNFVGRVMSLWIKIQISKGDLQAAEEGLLIQMACARHVSRTPFYVCNLVGVTIARIGFEQLEELIQQPKAKNFYHALAMLPNNLGETQATAEFEANIILGSIPSLDGEDLPPIGDARWKAGYQELFDNFISGFHSGDDFLDEKDHQAKIAAEDLIAMEEFSEEQLKKMSQQEIFLRWLLLYSKKFNSKYLQAVQLPAHEAIQALAVLEKEVLQMEKGLWTTPANETPRQLDDFLFSAHTVAPYIACHGTGRDAKLLQIVEAIRHYASQNENRLPESLSDIQLFLPADPFTNQPAKYELKEGVATLRWPSVPNVRKKLTRSAKTYKIRMADPN